MGYLNPKSAERVIARLSREIADIEDFFYHSERNSDRSLYASMLERKRDDIIRSAVVQLHTATENVLDTAIERAVLGTRTTPRRKGVAFDAMCRLLRGGRGLGFDRKLDLALAVRVLDQKSVSKLRALNGVRNKCSHNWVLAWEGRRKGGTTRPPFLNYSGADVYSLNGFKRLLDDISPLYLRLFHQTAL
jgi:hypothetical protein